MLLYSYSQKKLVRLPASSFVLFFPKVGAGPREFSAGQATVCHRQVTIGHEQLDQSVQARPEHSDVDPISIEATGARNNTCNVADFNGRTTR
ncbi:hypothetical protein PSHT_10524 [Puccinia striiformis]|uniref:Uncharacterized protein n=3 Tax=Puccinia striiformis TaxID=27350 RepID=A0A0L0UUL0_9BASI|nr:hypothetical protein PSTG_15862 [Puccinia striiformis f. sp. tritici PST-78]POV97124.1 hypothetical protein PSTT_15265 [Puccinia striiformis]POW06080.1 hypothetical protein PSHT_10524 [Puccinia striiformis]